MIVDYFTSDADGHKVVRHVDIPDNLMSKEYVAEVLAAHEDKQEGYKAIEAARLAAMVDTLEEAPPPPPPATTPAAPAP